MDEQNKNLLLATALSALVIVVWVIFFPPPTPVEDPNAGVTTAQNSASQAPTAEAGSDTLATEATNGISQATATAARVAIDTPRLEGSISLQGGRIDDLALKDYRETLDPNSPLERLLTPVGSDEPFFALYGWAPAGDLDWADVPGADTIWSLASGTTLTPETPITLSWDNGKGLMFSRTIAIDEDYLFTVTQSVQNNSGVTARMAPSNELVRIGAPSDLMGFFILHEGAIRQSGLERNEFDYGDLEDLNNDARWGKTAETIQVQSNGWTGFTDHFWQAILIPAPDQAFESVLKYSAREDSYKTITRLAAETVEPGKAVSVTTKLFAGAKEWDVIRKYERKEKVYEFVDSIDWGWFFFLTKPIFQVLHFMNNLIGNMGWAIIALTVVIKALLFPLAYKSYVSMARMKELQPEMEKLKERAGDDRQKMQQEMMKLYKEKKVNPAAGCLPILLQIPIFFSLYKVIFVTIELRHAPFIFWIKDLSAPDPTSFLNLFGLMPWGAPGPDSLLVIFSIGVLPILMGVSMWMQQKLNPAPTDPMQAQIFAWMPWVFMFMLGRFASGLVVYWVANNTITFTQQYLIMRSQGVKPDVFGNIVGGFKRKKGKAKG